MTTGPDGGVARRTLILVGTLVVVALAVLGLVLFLTGSPAPDETRLGKSVFLSDGIVFGGVGGYLALVRPAHPAGWLLGLEGIVDALDSVLQGVLGHGSPAALLGWALWLNNWTWPVIFIAPAVLLLRFPDGRLLSARWRFATPTAIAVGAVVALACAGERHSTDWPGIVSPVDLGPLSRLPGAALTAVVGGGTVVFTLAIAAGVVSLLIRRHSAVGVERTQLRWLLWAAGLLIVVSVGQVVIAAVGAWLPRLVGDGFDVAQQFTVFAIPIAIFVAVSRHGLFEIDRVISRTLAYTLVTALLAAVYVAIVTSASALVPGRRNTLPVVAATLAVAALFIPLRRRISAVVDRRFNRGRYDAERVVAGFAAGLRARPDRHDIAADLLAVLETTVQPGHVSLWVAPTGVRR